MTRTFPQLRVRAAGWALWLLSSVVVSGARAQQPGQEPFQSSPYLHLRHWAYPYVDLLVERGVLSGLSPVVRPYRRVDVARAMLAADEERLSPVEERWLERLRRELRAEIEALEGGDARSWAAVELSVDGSGMTQSHRDPLRPQGASRLEGAIEGDLRLAFPGVAAQSRLRSDSYFRDDPQFFPRRVAENRFNQRAEDAYVEVQTRHLRLLVGRLYRNWAPSRVQGTLLSDYAYSYEQAALWAGTDAVSLALVVARLDDFPGDVRRYLALHRLDLRPSPNLALYLGEGALYAGPGRDFEPDFLNPLSFWFTENETERDTREVRNNNLFATAGFWWRPHPSFIAFGEFTLDDVKVDEGAQNGTRFAFYGGFVLPRLAQGAAARVTYSLVSSLAYRSFADFERYTFRELGLARDFADHYLLSAELDLFPTASLWLTPRVDLLRRGEGDFRDPFPADFDTLPRVLIGTVETTVRLSVGGRWQPADGLLVQWDAGESFVRNVDHAEGATDSRFVGRATVRLFGRRSGFVD